MWMCLEFKLQFPEISNRGLDIKRFAFYLILYVTLFFGNLIKTPYLY